MEMDIKSQIVKLRKAVRNHRDKTGDDRSWVDDYALYELIPGNKRVLPNKISSREFMKRCKAFYENRNLTQIGKESNDFVFNMKKVNDDDLEGLDQRKLKIELNRLRRAIAKHRDVKREKTFIDDKLLYFTLPEKLMADFRLPPRDEFLGDSKSGKGCVNFLKSHKECKGSSHNYHEWGPCKQI